MKHLLLALSLFVLVNSTYAQTYQWAKQLGGTSAESGRGVCNDPSGNVISAGYFTGTFDANPGAATNNLTAGSPGNSGYVSKLDSNGNYIWGFALTGGATDTCEIYGVCSDASGNVYITGYAKGNIDFDPGAGTVNIGTGVRMSIVAKYTSAGAYVWAKAVSGGNTNRGISVAVDGSGNVIVGGAFSGTNIDFDPGAGTYPITGSISTTDAYILKLTSAGAFTWAFSIASNSSDQVQCVRTDAAANIYVSGYTGSAATDFDPGAGTAVLTGVGGYDAFVAKYTSAGVYAWVKTWGTANTDVVNGLAIDASQNVYLTGYFNGTMDADPGQGSTILTGVGAEDIFVCKLTGAGVFIWAKMIGGTGTDISNGIAIDVNASPYLTGYFEGAVDFDPSASAATKTSFGLKDAFVVSLSSAGLYNWVKQIGGTTDDLGYGIAVTAGATANIYSTGNFSGTGNFNAPSTANLTSFGAADAYLQRLSFNTCIAPTTPTVNTTANSVCSGGSVTLSIATGNLNDATAWQWYSGGCGTTSAGSGTSITVSPTANTTYSVRGEGGCVTPGICGTKTIAFSAAVTPTIQVTIPNTTVCAGASATFTAIINNGGNSPTYQWKKNNVNIAGATAATYTSTTLVSNDQISCVLTSNVACATTTTVTSNIVTVTVPASVAPTINITTPTTSICSGASATFTAAITNGGPNPAYQWKKNNVNITGATAATYTSTTLANNDQITCVLTSNAPCATTTTATSNTITVTVAASVAPTITISTPQTTICAGANATFTAAITNGGSSPTYQWKRNNVVVTGVTASTYQAGSISNQDVFTCVLTSNSACASPTTATSNSITITVANPVTPSITIANTTGGVCAGQPITFTAAITNGGANPAYQWKKDGVLVSGQTSSTYTAVFAGNETISCLLTSNAPCATATTVESQFLSTTVYQPIGPGISITASQSTICTGGSVTFTANRNNAGSTPTFQWKLNGNNISGATGSTYTSTSLANNDQVSCVITSSLNCASPTTATSNIITITVSSSVTPSIAITANPTGPVCQGASVTFTAVPTNGGAAPTYQWKVNGVNVTGQTSTTFASSTLANNAQVTCELTSNAGCASPLTATSNTIAMTVNQPFLPTISISASQTTICAGTSVTFSSSVTGVSSVFSFQWKKNGVNIPGETSSSYTTTGLANNDQITCSFTTNYPCASPSTVSSNTVTMVVNPMVTPSVTIAATQTTICTGNNVTFTATVANGGTSPTYQWSKNGNAITGANSATYTTVVLANGDVISCSITSNAPCATTSSANSNNVTIAVSSTVVPAISVAAPQTTICNGSSLTLTATQTNGGANPVYQWKKNNVNITGATSATYSTTTAATGDSYSCVLTSSVSCAVPTSATSNAVVITVNPTVTPTVTINQTTVSPCAGATVDFTSAITNGGSSPAYQWKKGGVAISGETDPTLSAANLVDGDAITLELTSNAACPSQATVTSTPITLTFVPTITPSVSVSASQTSICSGSSVTFTARATNGGSSPTYQWQLNGNNITGATSVTYNSAGLVDADEVSCILTSNAACATASTATSNAVTISITTSAVASVTVTASADTICNGNAVVFTALPVEGGSAPVYQWKKNTVDVTGATAITYSDAALTSLDLISCQMTSNSTCVTQPVVLSNNKQTIVHAIPDVTLSLAGNTLSVPASGTYQWVDCGSGNAIGGATGISYTATASGNYSVIVTSFEGCADTSACQAVSVVGINEPGSAALSVMPNPFTDNIYIHLNGNAAGKETLVQLYAIEGRLVKSFTLLVNQSIVALNDLCNGVYLLRITNDKMVYEQKLVKQ